MRDVVHEAMSKARRAHRTGNGIVVFVNDRTDFACEIHCQLAALFGKQHDFRIIRRPFFHHGDHFVKTAFHARRLVEHRDVVGAEAFAKSQAEIVVEQKESRTDFHDAFDAVQHILTEVLVRWAHTTGYSTTCFDNPLPRLARQRHRTTPTMTQCALQQHADMNGRRVRQRLFHGLESTDEQFRILAGGRSRRMKAQRQREIRQSNVRMLPPYFGNCEIQIVRKHSDNIQKLQPVCFTFTCKIIV